MISREEKIRLGETTIVYPEWILPSDSKIKKGFDYFVFLIILLNSFLNPIDIAFTYNNNSLNNFFTAFNWLSIAIFSLDIVVTFRTTYYDEDGNEIVDHKMIAINYITSIVFYLDVFSTLPISEIV